MKNSVLRDIARQMTASGIDLDIYGSVIIQLTDGSEVNLVCKPDDPFAEPHMFTQGASGYFYRQGYSADDTLLEMRRQKKARNNGKMPR